MTLLELFTEIEARLQDASEDCDRACDAMVELRRGKAMGNSPGYHATGARIEITTARANLALLRRMLEGGR